VPLIPMVIGTKQPGRREPTTSIPAVERPDHLLGSGMNDEVANLLIAQLLFLESEDPDKDIILYQLAGGMVTAGLASTTPCSTSSRDIATVASVRPPAWEGCLLTAGTRQALLAANARILIHQPMGGFQGILGHRDPGQEILRMKDSLNQFWCGITAKTMDAIQRDYGPGLLHERRRGQEYGIIDHVIANRQTSTA